MVLNHKLKPKTDFHTICESAKLKVSFKSQHLASIQFPQIPELALGKTKSLHTLIGIISFQVRKKTPKNLGRSVPE